MTITICNGKWIGWMLPRNAERKLRENHHQEITDDKTKANWARRFGRPYTLETTSLLYETLLIQPIPGIK
jgi:hypothetical protein